MSIRKAPRREILGQALKGKRDQALISTKGTFPMGEGDNERGSSRHHIVRACEASLKRLGTDHIDVYFMHGFDALTPIEETLRALDDLTQRRQDRLYRRVELFGLASDEGPGHLGEIRLGPLRRLYQGYYSLVGRDYEWELMPLGVDQGVGLMVWSPLGWGRLTGKIRRGEKPAEGRLSTKSGEQGGPQVDEDYLFDVVDVLDHVAEETGKTVSQISLNWLLSRPTVANIVVGARNEEQLKQNLGAIGWSLTPDQIGRLDAASRPASALSLLAPDGFRRPQSQADELVGLN